MSDDEFDKKIERATKALGVFKQLGEAFGGGKKELPLNLGTIDDKLVNSIFFIENSIRNLTGNVGDILILLSKSQKIKDLIAFIEREKFINSEGKSSVNTIKVLEMLNGIL